MIDLHLVLFLLLILLLFLLRGLRRSLSFYHAAHRQFHPRRWRLFCDNKILPVSISCFNLKVVTPVSFSPLMIAQLRGAAPRYCGSNDPCKLIVPIGGMFQTTSGNILKATTICRSAFNDLNSFRKSLAFNFSGCKVYKPFSTAYFFTALCCNCTAAQPLYRELLLQQLYCNRILSMHLRMQQQIQAYLKK